MGHDNTSPRCAGALAALVGLVLTATAAHGARLYRWKDAAGNVHYGDTMPQAAASERHSVLDAQGRVREEIPSTAEIEAAARREQAERARQTQREAASRRQQQQDRMLLETFTSEADLEATRDRRLEAQGARIRLIAHQVGQLEGERARWTAHLDALPDSMTADAPARRKARMGLDQIRERLEQRRADLAREQTRRTEMERQFRAYLVRYRELRSARAEADR